MDVADGPIEDMLSACETYFLEHCCRGRVWVMMNDAGGENAGWAKMNDGRGGIELI